MYPCCRHLDGFWRRYVCTPAVDTWMASDEGTYVPPAVDTWVASGEGTYVPSAVDTWVASGEGTYVPLL